MKRLKAWELVSLGWSLGKFGRPVNRELEIEFDPIAGKTRLEFIAETVRETIIRTTSKSAIDTVETAQQSGRRIRTEYDFAVFCDDVKRAAVRDLIRGVYWAMDPEKAARAFQKRHKRDGPGYDDAPFGTDLVEREFPELKQEIGLALFSWACELHTACVFHLMRVVEAGLRRITHALNADKQLPERPEWRHHLKIIDDHTKTPHLGREEEQFYSAAAGYIRAISKAWRNPVVHELAESYTEREATKILNFVESLMEEIAEHLGTKENP